MQPKGNTPASNHPKSLDKPLLGENNRAIIVFTHEPRIYFPFPLEET
jgi:hypothetical protein